MSPVGSSTNPYANATPSVFEQRKAAFQALATALQSGDLAAAQTAFATVQPSASNGQSAQSVTSAVQDPLNNDLQTLASALQSGDLAGAQKAFAALQQDMQKIGGHRHHHHHHHHPKPAQQPADAVASTTADASTINLQA
jgi:hypothetical protein